MLRSQTRRVSGKDHLLNQIGRASEYARTVGPGRVRSGKGQHFLVDQDVPVTLVSGITQPMVELLELGGTAANRDPFPCTTAGRNSSPRPITGARLEAEEALVDEGAGLGRGRIGPEAFNEGKGLGPDELLFADP